MDKSPKVAARQLRSTVWKSVGFYKKLGSVGNTVLQKDIFTALRWSSSREFTIASTSTTLAVLAPEPLRSPSQGSSDPRWQGFEPKKRFHLLIELRYIGGQAPNPHTYSISAVPTKDLNGESMSLLWILKATRGNYITTFIFVSTTH